MHAVHTSLRFAQGLLACKTTASLETDLLYTCNTVSHWEVPHAEACLAQTKPEHSLHLRQATQQVFAKAGLRRRQPMQQVFAPVGLQRLGRKRFVAAAQVRKHIAHNADAGLCRHVSECELIACICGRERALQADARAALLRRLHTAQWWPSHTCQKAHMSVQTAQRLRFACCSLHHCLSMRRYVRTAIKRAA